MLLFAWEWELGFIHFFMSLFWTSRVSTQYLQWHVQQPRWSWLNFGSATLATLAWHFPIGRPRQLDVTMWTLSLPRRTSVHAQLTQLTHAFKLRPSNSSNFPLLHQSNPLEEAPVRAQSSRLSSNVPNVFLNACLPQNYITSLIDSPISCVVLFPRVVSQLFTHSV